MAALFNLARMTTTTTGTGSTIALTAAVSGFLTFALAGVTNGTVVSYAIRDGNNSEVGTATYSTTGPQLTGRTPVKSTNSDAAINLSGSAEIAITPLASDIIPTTRTITAGTGLTGGGDLSADRTISLTVPVAVSVGGTGLTTTTQGDILYADATNSLAKLAKNATASRYLSNSGASNNPAWAQVDLTNGVTGVLPAANLPGSFNGFANPTNPGVNLTGANGSAATAMRSDAVLVLDQAIAPNWTGQHTHTVARTIASATAAALDDINIAAATTTITGATGSPITRLAKVGLYRPTITDSSAVTVTDAATLYVDNSPLAAGSVTITNAWAILVGAGNVKFSGTANNVGTVTVGTWNGTTIAVANGGTGATTLTGLLQGNGTSAVTAIANSSTVGQVLRVTGASTYAWGALDLADVDAITNDLPFANLAQGSARSVLGVTGNATADVASIQGTANQVLVVNSGGTALAFGQVNLASTSAVTGQLVAGSFPALTGDVTTAGGALATTLATVNSNVGTFGSVSADPVITVNGKGLITAVSTVLRKEVLTADRTYFVAATGGSDSNNGLSSGAPFATLAKALSTIYTVNWGGFACTLQLADGTYTSNLSISSYPDSCVRFDISGNNTTPANVVWNSSTTHTLSLGCAGYFRIFGFAIGSSSGGGSAVNIGGGAQVDFSGNMRWTAIAANQSHINVGPGCYVARYASQTITAGQATAGTHIKVTTGGYFIEYNSITITLSGSPVFGKAFAHAYGQGKIESSTVTYSGAAGATTPRFVSELNGVINSFGVWTASTAFAGTANGTTATGGQFA